MATTLATPNGVPTPLAQNATNGTSTAIPKVAILPYAYDRTDSERSALRIIHAARPEWNSPIANIKFIRCKDGITNTLLKAVNEVKGATADQVDNEAILLRAYGAGTHVLIDREREVENHELLMAHNLAPELLARFQNGIVYRYIRGDVTSAEDLRKPEVYSAVASRLAEWHARIPCLPAAPAESASNEDDGVLSRRRESIDSAAPGKPAPNMWTVMKKWIFALPTDTEEQRQQQMRLQADMDQLIKDLSQRPGLGKNGVSILAPPPPGLP